MNQPSRSYAGVSAEQRRNERRHRLVLAAVEVLARDGGARTTMTAICAEAGLTERYFYESFRGRDEALAAALEAVCREIAEVAVAALGRASGPSVRAVVEAVVDLVAEQPQKGRVATIESTSTPALRARRHELVLWLADIVATHLGGVLGPAAWPPHRARLHAMVFVAGFAELVASWLLGSTELSRAELVDVGTDLLEATTQH